MEDLSETVETMDNKVNWLETMWRGMSVDANHMSSYGIGDFAVRYSPSPDQ